jgi:hypothetical protein
LTDAPYKLIERLLMERPKRWGENASGKYARALFVAGLNAEKDAKTSLGNSR